MDQVQAVMYPPPTGRRLRSKAPTVSKSKVVGMCTFLDEEEGKSRYRLMDTPGNDKLFMCGAHLMADSEEYPFELPKQKKLKHWKSLCPHHYKVYNDEFEKFFFRFENSGHQSPESSLMSSPSGKRKAVSYFS